MRQRWFVTAILAVSVSLLAHVALGQLITEFPVPTASSGVLGITAAPDGNLWFTEQSANKLGRITLAGVITEFPLP
jgi:streptogramin lyase